jgi:GST-like protein
MEVTLMIDLYYWPTPNGWKITILLEETAIPYRVVPVDIGRGDQFEPEFLKISPNNRMPAIVDNDGPDGRPISIFESGAILVYLAEKSGSFLGADARSRYEVMQWLMWQMGGIGPMFGQAGHFMLSAPEPIPYAIERYTKEAKRLTRVLDLRLGDRPFVAGDYSIADMASFPWVQAAEKLLGLSDFPNVAGWVEKLRARPAVKRGLAVLAEESDRRPEMTDERRSILFGDRQFARH